MALQLPAFSASTVSYSHTLSNANDGFPMIFVVALLCTLLGMLLGSWWARLWAAGRVRPMAENNARHVSTAAINPAERKGPDSASKVQAEQQVLQGAMDLFCRQWERTNPSQHMLRENPRHSILEQKRPRNGTNVVQYLKPEDMLEQLFHNSDEMGSLSLCRYNKRTREDRDGDSNDDADADAISANGTEGDEQNDSKAQHFLHLLRQIQTYSVNTSHPRFFNQLFGTMDPVALAAELVALGLNTSAYTYETAPVFTLMEREVMDQLGRLVFDGCDENKIVGRGSGVMGSDATADCGSISYKYDGIMVPGGSLSNLTALHIARHRWLVRHGYDPPIHCRQEDVQCQSFGNSTADSDNESEDGEEKKDDQSAILGSSNGGVSASLSLPLSTADNGNDTNNYDPKLVAFVSMEAHYSFQKAMAVIGIGASNLIAVPTHRSGRMNVRALDEAMTLARQRGCIPFFVAATSGSTVRGSFDDIRSIVELCKRHEEISFLANGTVVPRSRIWVHVDGAWGGSAIFSRRPDISELLSGLNMADSFTFNPHKMLGAPNQTSALVTRHRGLLQSSNSTGAKYLFDPRKNGAKYDLGDATFTCGRRPDVVKLWALWKYYGREGLGKRVEEKADSLTILVDLLQHNNAFMLACDPWPFNVNFFYLPPRLRREFQHRGITTNRREFSHIPDDLAKELAKISVQLKLKLHEAGEMIIPFQPLNDQDADCFRLVLAGDKALSRDEFCEILSLMDRHGRDM